MNFVGTQFNPQQSEQVASHCCRRQGVTWEQFQWVPAEVLLTAGGEGSPATYTGNLVASLPPALKVMPIL